MSSFGSAPSRRTSTSTASTWRRNAATCSASPSGPITSQVMRFRKSSGRAGQRCERKVLSLAMRQSRDRDDNEPVRCQPICLTDRGARSARAKPEIGNAEPHRDDASRIDGEPFAEQALGIAAVGDNSGPRSENTGAADRKSLQRRLGLVDLGAVHRHHHAGPRPPARKRQRNEERPIGGVNHVVADRRGPCGAPARSWPANSASNAGRRESGPPQKVAKLSAAVDWA